MGSKESDILNKMVVATAFLLFDRKGPLRHELASEIIRRVFEIEFKDIPRLINSSEYVNFALEFWRCMCMARLKYGV